jgi:hypothetical protein
VGLLLRIAFGIVEHGEVRLGVMMQSVHFVQVAWFAVLRENRRLQEYEAGRCR